MYPIDILIIDKKSNKILIIEADGSSHYYGNNLESNNMIYTPHKLGKTVLKYFIFEN
jgi:hypothetical protein